MRFLVDENLPREVAQLLIQREHDVLYVPDSDLRRSEDDKLWTFASEEQRILVTKDLDFPLMTRPVPAGLVLIRVPPEWGRREIAGLFSRVIERIEVEGMSKIVVVTPSRIRVRSL